MRDNQPILEQACGNVGLTRKCMQIPHDAGHLTGLHMGHGGSLSLFAPHGMALVLFCVVYVVNYVHAKHAVSGTTIMTNKRLQAAP